MEVLRQKQALLKTGMSLLGLVPGGLAGGLGGQGGRPPGPCETLNSRGTSGGGREFIGGGAVSGGIAWSHPVNSS